jgi:hypothetical protein
MIQHRFSLRSLTESGYAFLATIIFFISAIAFAGLRPLGHALVQFMIVWQR